MSSLKPPEFDASFNRTTAGMRFVIPRVFKRIKRLLQHESGASAIEFAFLLPLMTVFLLAIAMAGLQTKNFIHAQQVVRAGAAAAQNDPGGAAVRERMTAVAIAKGYTIADLETMGAMNLTSARVCFCPQNPFVGRTCDTICPDQRPVTAAYELTAVHRDPRVVGFFVQLARLLRTGFDFGMGRVQVRTQVILR
jgi:Flp pilus assembly pilin Flp